MDKLVENKFIQLGARVAIFVATFIGLPSAAWMMNRAIDKIDTISEKVDDQNLKLQLLDQSVQFGFRETKADIGGIRIQLSDHEGRIRLIERATPVTPR